MGLEDELSSLEPGKQADLILVDLTELNLSPVLEAPVRVPGPRAPVLRPPNLVYAGSGHEVVTVMVAGKVLVANVDEIRAVTADLVHKEMALLDAMEAGFL